MSVSLEKGKEGVRVRVEAEAPSLGIEGRGATATAWCKSPKAAIADAKEMIDRIEGFLAEGEGARLRRELIKLN